MNVTLGQWATNPGVQIDSTNAVQLVDGSYIARAEIHRPVHGTKLFTIRDPNFRKKNKVLFLKTEQKFCLRKDCVKVQTDAGETLFILIEKALKTSDGNYFFSPKMAEQAGYYFMKGRWIRPIANAGYHELQRVDKSHNAKYKVGVEIEKEDGRAKRIPYEEVYEETRWCKEDDGSLGSGGYELVSPVYNLYSDEIEKDAAKLSDLINAGYSSRCGGHMNVSVKGKSSSELLKELGGYLPLLYALYPSRTTAGYSRALPISQYRGGSKGAAVSLKGGGVLEFRIFPAVENVRDLMWRLNLLRFMLKNPISTVKKLGEMMQNPELKELIGSKRLNVEKYYHLCV